MTAPNVVEQVVEQAAPVEVGRVAAQRRLGAIRNAVAVADDLLAQAYAARDWAALGHADWTAYCAAELPELRYLKLRAETLRARVAAMLAAAPADTPPTITELVAATGASRGSVHAAVQRLTGSYVTVTEGPSTGKSKADLTVELVAARGARGMTVRELCRKAGWHHGQASGQLSRLNRRGRVRATSTIRNGYCVYVVDPA